MAKKKKVNAAQKDIFNIQEQLSTAACVPAIREAVKTWRAEKYKGITDTTRELLNHWFYTDHTLPNGQTFRDVSKYEEKVGALQEEVSSHEKNVEALQTELSNLK